MQLFVLFCGLLALSAQKQSIKLKKQTTHHKRRQQKFLEQQVLSDDMVDLIKQENFYLAQVEVGTPPQIFQVLIDTGSPNLVLTSTLCHQESCYKHGSYNPSLSSTSYYIEAIKLANGEIGNEIDIQFATGSVEGVFFEDRVCLRDMCVQEQLIIGVVEETEDIFSQMKFDGILGLGRLHEAVVQNASFLQNLNRDHQNFSLYLSEEQPSELVLGGISPQLIADGHQFYYFQTTTKHLWTVSLRAIYLGNQRIDNCDIIPCQGLIDSGTSFVSFSDYPMNIFLSKFGIYQPCGNLDMLPDLIFQFDNGVRFYLTSQQYFRRNGRISFGEDVCIPFIKQSPVLSQDEQLFVLGQPFLTKHYVWFDEKGDRIGIARSKQ